MCRRVTPKTQVLNAIEKLTWTSMNVCADACVKCETWPELENECHQILCAFPITMRCEDISTGNGNRHARLDAPLFAIQHFDLIRGTVKMTRLSDVRWLWCYDHSYIFICMYDFAECIRLDLQQYYSTVVPVSSYQYHCWTSLPSTSTVFSTPASGVRSGSAESSDVSGVWSTKLQRPDVHPYGQTRDRSKRIFVSSNLGIQKTNPSFASLLS